MRELKFRIWDKNKNEWLGASDSNSLEWYGFHLVGECMTVQAPPHWALDNGVVEQYTGLKDKNSVEIYEGDVVSEHKGDIKGEVVQSVTGEWQIAWAGIFGGYSCLYDHTSLCEVVGNVHENSE